MHTTEIREKVYHRLFFFERCEKEPFTFAKILNSFSFVKTRIWVTFFPASLWQLKHAHLLIL